MAETQRTLGPREGESMGSFMQLDTEVDDERIKSERMQIPFC